MATLPPTTTDSNLTPDNLAKRLFQLALLGCLAYVAVIVALVIE